MAKQWWEYPELCRHVARRISGKESPDINSAISEKIKSIVQTPLESGISNGCGKCQKEIHLIQSAIVNNLKCYDINPERLRAASKSINALKLTDKIQLYNCDSVKNNFREYDLVYWNASLHHMLVEDALNWSFDRLVKGGLFFAFEYVGRNRLRPYHEITEKIKKLTGRCKYKAPPDPMEAVESEKIIPYFKRMNFKKSEIIPLGGAFFHHYIPVKPHNEKVGLSIYMDDIYYKSGLSEFAILWGIK